MMKIRKIKKLVTDLEGYDFIVIKSLKKFFSSIEQIQHECNTNDGRETYHNIENYESNFDKLLGATHKKIACGFGNLEKNSFAVPAGYRFRDILWELK